VDKGDQHRDAYVAIDEGACRLVTAIEVSAPAEPEINRHQHKSCPMSNRHGEGPEAELCRSYPRERSRMARVDEQENSEDDHQKAGANLDLALPFDEGGQQREGKHHHQHGQEVADSQWPQRRNERARVPFHQSG
jgi:hypothetical protein